MSDVLEMLKDPNHRRLTDTSHMGHPYYILRGNTIYGYKRFYQGKTWLLSQSQKFKENSWGCYIPIATKKGDTHIGYMWERANMSSWLLSLGDATRSWKYPNLYWCDVGLHPYPKEIRRVDNWLQNSFNRIAHKLVYPNVDIVKAVIFPSDLEDSPTPP